MENGTNIVERKQI